MLVVTEDSRMPVGVVVCEWKIKGETRYFALFPYKVGDRLFVEVEVPGRVAVIAPAMSGWERTKEGFGDENAGYPLNEQTTKDLYFVWDDGASTHPEASSRLYDAFAGVFDHYKDAANDYLKATAMSDYEESIAEAKRRGWDTDLVKREEITFPYYS